MTTLAIRQQLHNYLEIADDKKIKAIYTMMEAEIKERVVEYSDDFKGELDRRQAVFKSGKAKIITAGESKKRIQKILKSAGRE